jgi:hypothetical protein
MNVLTKDTTLQEMHSLGRDHIARYVTANIRSNIQIFFAIFSWKLFLTTVLLNVINITSMKIDHTV